MRYYGGKTKLIGFIDSIVEEIGLEKNSKVFDVFSGTSVVGQHFKKKNFTVYSNDFLYFSYCLSNCYIKLNEKPKFKKLLKISDPIKYLNSLDGTAGFITRNYSPYNKCARMYLSTTNAMRVDAIREKIEDWFDDGLINFDEKSYLITSLIEGINLVSNVTGTYAAFLKTWDNRAKKQIMLSEPEIVSSKNKHKSFNLDANEAVKLDKFDLLYLDPPYNSRQYASNYFFLELIAEGWFDQIPQIYGLTGMCPYEDKKSLYSSSRTAAGALQDLVESANSKYIMLSYNNEGLISTDEILKILKARGKVKIFEQEHKRYRAINQDGTNIKTQEYIYLLEMR